MSVNNLFIAPVHAKFENKFTKFRLHKFRCMRT